MSGEINRREFLKLSGLAAGYLFVPDFIKKSSTERILPSLPLTELPEAIRSIIEITPRTSIDNQGFLTLKDNKGTTQGRVPLAPTEWSKERQKDGYELRKNHPRGIVLHYFGDSGSPLRTVQNYLWGFDGIREVTTPDGETYSTVTSAHFVIGELKPEAGPVSMNDHVSILQTQEPYRGEATLASHLIVPLDRKAYLSGTQPFVSSLDILGKKYGFPKGEMSCLQEWFKQSWIDSNWYSYAIEQAGNNFDSKQGRPSNQLIANTLSVVTAIMKRDKIPATNVLGHHEIQTGKPDPGKSYMAEFRFLLGVKALTDKDDELKNLVFGPFLREGVNEKEAAKKYFEFVRDFLVMSYWGVPEKVFEWESRTKYWTVYDSLSKEKAPFPIADSFRMPIDGKIRYGSTFLLPENHEGVDFNTGEPNVINGDLGTPIKAITNGVCIFAKEIAGPGLGKTIMLRHRLPEGSEVISIYGHLNEIGLREGDICKIGRKIGTMGASGGQPDSHLHLAIAYGATWDTDLSIRPFAPANVGPTWITRRYLNPPDFINSRNLEEDFPQMRPGFSR